MYITWIDVCMCVNIVFYCDTHVVVVEDIFGGWSRRRRSRRRRRRRRRSRRRRRKWRGYEPGTAYL